MASILEAAKQDKTGAALAALVPLFFAIAAFYVLSLYPPPQIKRKPAIPPLAEAPSHFEDRAQPGDILSVEGLKIAYWGDPAAHYGMTATENASEPEGVVIHYTADKPILDLVKYQHNGDPTRGGSYGYHFYVDKHGRIVQGAPLSVRTNHIKPADHKRRKEAGAHLSSSNAIGVSLVGGCQLPPGPRAATMRCQGETMTRPQFEAAFTVAVAVMAAYGIDCKEVYGHGDLQRDRMKFEGYKVSRAIRRACRAEPST